VGAELVSAAVKAVSKQLLTCSKERVQDALPPASKPRLNNPAISEAIRGIYYSPTL
jgi:hypothetical protein